MGKSHLAAALALRALEEGHTAYFITLNQLMNNLQDARRKQQAGKRIRTYLKPKGTCHRRGWLLPLDREKQTSCSVDLSGGMKKGA